MPFAGLLLYPVGCCWFANVVQIDVWCSQCHKLSRRSCHYCVRELYRYGYGRGLLMFIWWSVILELFQSGGLWRGNICNIFLERTTSMDLISIQKLFFADYNVGYWIHFPSNYI